MKPMLSEKAISFKRNISPVRQIMSYANPAYFKGLGLDPKEVISFAGGWVNHTTPDDLQKSYQEIIEDNDLLHKSGGYSPTLGMPECKEALVKYEKHLYNVEGLEQSHIAIGASSTQLTFDLITVLTYQKKLGYKFKIAEVIYLQFLYEIFIIIHFFNAKSGKIEWI